MNSLKVLADHNLVKLLLESRANVSPGDENGPLFKASEAGYLETVKLLVSAGIDKNDMGYAASLASMKGHYDVVKYLIESKAEITNYMEKINLKS